MIHKWRPIFDRVGNSCHPNLFHPTVVRFSSHQFDHDHDGQIPLGELRAHLTNAAAESSIPPSVIDKIIRRADADQNGVLDFPEFMSMVQTHELALLYPNLNRMMKAAAFIAVPRNERLDVMHSGLETYKCCPPPIIMPLLSLVEVIKQYYSTHLYDVLIV